MRSTITAAPTRQPTRDLAFLTAFCLDWCISTLTCRLVTRRCDVAMLTGCSYTELVEKCRLLTSDYSPEHTYVYQEQLGLVASMINADPSDTLLSIITLRRVVGVTVRVVEASKALEAAKISTRSRRSLTIARGKDADWYDKIVQMWRQLLERGAARLDKQLAMQAIHSGMLFTLEWWSVTAPVSQLCERFSIKIKHLVQLIPLPLAQLTHAVNCVVDVVALPGTPQAVLSNLTRQLHVIVSRMAKPQVRKPVADASTLR